MYANRVADLAQHRSSDIWNAQYKARSSLVPKPSIAGGRPGIHCLRMRLISPKILENRISWYSSVKRRRRMTFTCMERQMRQKSVILSTGSFLDLLDSGAIHGIEVRSRDRSGDRFRDRFRDRSRDRSGDRFQARSREGICMAFRGQNNNNYCRGQFFKFHGQKHYFSWSLKPRNS